MNIDLDELNKDVEDDWIRVATDPLTGYKIYNYTVKTQFKIEWTPLRMACRGLILHGDRVVARPFSKFFNLSEHSNPKLPPLPVGEPFEVFEKMDGSLGIAYHNGKYWRIATRGSFNSEQALTATDCLYNKHSNSMNRMDKDLTYLFEIIYPSNRVVVNYGITSDLFMIGAIDTKTGTEIRDLRSLGLGFPITNKFECSDINELLQYERDNFEGFVVRYESGARVKIKLSSYHKLHKLISDCSPLAIWEMLSSNNGCIDDMPTELRDKASETVDKLVANYNKILDTATNFVIGNHLRSPCISRKDAAMRIHNELPREVQPAAFTLLSNRDPSSVIWKAIRPYNNVLE